MSEVKNMFVGFDQDAQFVRELEAAKEAAVAAMIAMSAEVELPESGVTEEDKETARAMAFSEESCCIPHWEELQKRACRERQLREVLTQNAALTALVADRQEGRLAALEAEKGLRSQVSELTAQVEELKLGDQASACECSGEEACAYLRRAEKAEVDLATAKENRKVAEEDYAQALRLGSLPATKRGLRDKIVGLRAIMCGQNRQITALKAELAALQEGE